MRKSSALHNLNPKQRAATYQKRWRDKKSKIERMEKALDALVTEMENLPRCETCRPCDDCTHTPERKALNIKIEELRTDLSALDH